MIKISEILENGWFKQCLECGYKTIINEKRCPKCDVMLDYFDEIGIYWEYRDRIIEILKEHGE